jgi:hypothetical protein
MTGSNATVANSVAGKVTQLPELRLDRDPLVKKLT